MTEKIRRENSLRRVQKKEYRVTVNLKREQGEKIEQYVMDGVYDNRSQVVREAVKLLLSKLEWDKK